LAPDAAEETAFPAALVPAAAAFRAAAAFAAAPTGAAARWVVLRALVLELEVREPPRTVEPFDRPEVFARPDVLALEDPARVRLEDPALARLEDFALVGARPSLCERRRVGLLLDSAISYPSSRVPGSRVLTLTPAFAG